MTTRRASCTCGQLHLETTGEPLRVSVCHCLAYQTRSGSAFAAQARFHRDQIKGPEEQATAFTRIGASGTAVTHSFRAVCGATVFYAMPSLGEGARRNGRRAPGLSSLVTGLTDRHPPDMDPRPFLRVLITRMSWRWPARCTDIVA